MSQIVVDTDVASYLFNWHSSAQNYANALHGSELILSFMSVAELRSSCSTRTTTSVRCGRGFVPTLGRWADQVVRKMPGSQRRHRRPMPHSQRTIGGIMSTPGASGCSPCDHLTHRSELYRVFPRGRRHEATVRNQYGWATLSTLLLTDARR